MNHPQSFLQERIHSRHTVAYLDNVKFEIASSLLLLAMTSGASSVIASKAKQSQENGNLTLSSYSGGVNDYSFHTDDRQG
jgi:hypothetical protein